MQLGVGCVSNCAGCERKEVPDNGHINDTQVLANLTKVIDRNIFDGNILFYNTDYFSLPDTLLDTITAICGNHFRKVFFHTIFPESNTHGQSRKVHHNILLQRDINRSTSNFELLRLTNILKRYILLGDSIFVYRFTGHEIMDMFTKRVLHIFPKAQVRYGNGVIKILLSEKIHISCIHMTGYRQGLERCRFLGSKNHQGFIFDEQYFPENCLEVKLNGDIAIHDPPCGPDRIIISNIERNCIGDDFTRFIQRWQGIIYTASAHTSERSPCIECRNHVYHFNT